MKKFDGWLATAWIVQIGYVLLFGAFAIIHIFRR